MCGKRLLIHFISSVVVALLVLFGGYAVKTGCAAGVGMDTTLTIRNTTDYIITVNAYFAQSDTGHEVYSFIVNPNTTTTESLPYTTFQGFVGIDGKWGATGSEYRLPPTTCRGESINRLETGLYNQKPCPAGTYTFAITKHKDYWGLDIRLE